MDDYYVLQSNYYTLKDFATKIRDINISSDDLINFMKKNKIDVNSYITTFNPGVYVPIYWQCVQPNYPNNQSLSNEVSDNSTLSNEVFSISTLSNHQHIRTKFFKFLVRNNVNLLLNPDVQDSKNFKHVLMTCHESYIKDLISTKDSISVNLDNQILNKLYTGNIRRLIILLKYEILTTNLIQNIITLNSSLLFDILNVLIDRISFICRTHNKKSEVQSIIQKYINVFKFIFKFKTETLNINSMHIIQYCANFYLYEFIALFKDLLKINLNHYRFKISYHDDMNQKLVASIRQLLNDNRYVLTCKSLDITPDKRAL